MERITKEVVKFDSIETSKITFLSERLKEIETILQSIETGNDLTNSILTDNIEKIEDLLTFFHVMSTSGLDV